MATSKQRMCFVCNKLFSNDRSLMVHMETNSYCKNVITQAAITKQKEKLRSFDRDNTVQNNNLKIDVFSENRLESATDHENNAINEM